MLKFDTRWRYYPPGKGTPALVNKVLTDVIQSIVVTCSTKHVYETFKRRFAHACGSPAGPSSDEGWARSDLFAVMHRTSDKNIVLFIEALYAGICDVEKMAVDAQIPPLSFINECIAETGYAISPPDLVLAASHKPVPVPVRTSSSLGQQASELIQESLSRSEKYLAEGNHRGAVQEVFWLLETITMAFRGTQWEEGQIAGKYFSKIIGDMRQLKRHTTLDQVTGWLMNIYGYLSAPDGGGVRHGANILNYAELTASEARLFCDLARSFISYFLHEHSLLQKA